MKHTHRKAGFSLMEVNMAVFVMAVGIMALVGLFPLGLRESYQGKADLQQSMFADYALNELVAALSQSDLTWQEWQSMGATTYPDAFTAPDGKTKWDKVNFPSCVQRKLSLPGLTSADGNACLWTVAGDGMQAKHHRIFFDFVAGSSARLMGISVRSTDIDAANYYSYTNNALYYAEVMFQGVP